MTDNLKTALEMVNADESLSAELKVLATTNPEKDAAYDEIIKVLANTESSSPKRN